MYIRSDLAASLTAFVVMMGCSSPPPYRTSLSAPPSSCADVYAKYDDASLTPAPKRQLVTEDLKDNARQKCWLSSWEKHANYDLFSVEFDDQGWLANSAANPRTVETQLTSLMDRLNALTKGESGEPPRSLSIVLYTHGWHHSAAANDTNVIAFRKLLASVSELENTLCLAKRPADERAKAGSCSESEQALLAQRKRHVVGIYVGWRGDSILGPLIEDSSIWDRKLAAEKVALGSVQELYARIHDFYLKHTCHSVGSELIRDCRERPDVRLLTIGHSFGGLITYRSLAPRLMLGVAETHRRSPQGATSSIPYAYGFGDLTVLINPAFEGTRFEPLAWAATHRDYQEGHNGTQETAQLPYLIVAQSKGDLATRIAFPMFRYVTTLFESAPGVEGPGNINTVGWTDRYITHELVMDPGNDACPGVKDSNDSVDRLNRQTKWANANLKTGFDGDVHLCNGLWLKKGSPDTSEAHLPRKAFMPLWVIKTDPAIIYDHNDFLNPRFVDFVWQIYYAILTEDEAYTERLISSHPH